jgi:hypothetical protein
LRFGFGQRWKEHARQNRDDRDHDEKLNKREGVRVVTTELAAWLTGFHGLMSILPEVRPDEQSV